MQRKGVLVDMLPLLKHLDSASSKYISRLFDTIGKPVPQPVKSQFKI
jgi:hypothetical protein